MMSEQLTDKEKLAELKKWFIENPKLPDEIDDLLLKRFLKCVNGDMEEAKRVIEHNYTLRNKHPNIFFDRDPNDDCLREFHKLYDIIPLPGLTPEGHKLVIFRFNDRDPSKVNTTLECKTFHLVADCRFTMLDVEKPKISDCDKKEQNSTDEDEYENDTEADTANEVEDEVELHLAEGDIQIIDMSHLTLSHMARVSFFTMRAQLKFVQEAFPMRLCGSHMINCPSFLDKLISIVRPFIKDEVFNLTRFHTDGIEGLYEHVPRDMLPNEYGGKAGTMQELKEKWINVLETKRPYLTDPKYWKVEQTKSRWSWW